MCPEAWSGDLGKSNTWPDGFYEKLDSLRQGHIIDGIPLFFLESAEFELWQPPREKLSGPPVAISGPADHPTFSGMVLTQACDLMKRNNPWITVAPVYPARGRIVDGLHPSIRMGLYSYFVPLSAEWCENDLWVADLRLELPVEKSYLANATEKPAFSTDLQYELLGEALAARRNRPPVPQNCVDYVSNPLQELIQGLRDAGASLGHGVSQVRLQWDDPTNASVVTVFVIKQEDEAVDEGGWADVIDQVRSIARDHDISVAAVDITDLWEMSAADFISSGLIDDLFI